VENLEVKAGKGKEQHDLIIRFVPGPRDDPDGSIQAAGLQIFQYARTGDPDYMCWHRLDAETEDQFMARAKSEAPPHKSGWSVRSFFAYYRGGSD
jgi:hypothetical protein